MANQIEPQLAQIEKFLRVIIGNDTKSVFEIRILKAGRERTVSGYYDVEHINKAIKDIMTYNGKYNIYITLNQVNPALLARAKNRIKAYSEKTTGDKDICARKWILIDVDPVRPTGISATDAEKAEGEKVIRCVIKHLRQQEWPDPMVFDSGNGYHALYPVDMPNNATSTELIKKILEGLSDKFNTPYASIDTCVYNAARISKLIGTVACKGDNTEDRPHRKSRILQIPDMPNGVQINERQVLTIEKLKHTAIALVTKPQQVSKTVSITKFSERSLTVEQIINEKGLKVYKKKNVDDGILYEIDCPFNSDHKREASITQFNDGNIRFKCFHNSCSDMTTRQFVEYYYPGFYDKQNEKLKKQGDKKIEISSNIFEEWREIIPLSTYKLPAFPVQLLPGWLKDTIITLSKALQTPLELAGMIGIAAVSAAIAKKINIKARPGWIEPLNIYTIVALPPASRKSAVITLLTAPLFDYEQKLADGIKLGIKESVTKKEIIVQRLEKVKKDAVKNREKELEALEITRELEAMEIPNVPQLMVDDVTPERLAGLLAEQGGKMALFSAEGGIIDILAGRYSNGVSNLDVFLKAHAGDSLKVDRGGRPPESVKKPALTVGLAIQPAVLTGLINKPGFRGKGLLARFLYVIPENNIGRRKINTPPFSDNAKRIYYQNMINLLDIGRITGDEIYSLKLTFDASQVLIAFEEDIEPRLGPGGDLESIQDWGGKLAGAVVRLAGILHIADHVNSKRLWEIPVSEKTIHAAVEIGRFLIQHALPAFDLMGANNDLEAARRVLSWIERKGCEEFKKTDCHKELRGSFRKIKELEPGLKLLTEYGYIRQKMNEKRQEAGRPLISFEVNPEYIKSILSNKIN
ncbi:YfjI family protein [Oceanirhabdus seepicola]|uniref:DUF3987 domain-containing protein n=1 Tax=Oceanirhabdus seepicola TaxID=2828781 RepID=A0A9J6P6B5_9CLOT|nr:YfjI family protein [Oceanirhabdus seepicola]MCM1991333.1 DUF3987 domain-containing protein [Oceanirhabdus seepicola]